MHTCVVPDGAALALLSVTAARLCARAGRMIHRRVPRG
eukprot:COSAG01_NODE_55039_length_328_cov_0.576419_1_plen_37_part_10